MADVKCRKCGEPVSKKEKECPNCGIKNPSVTKTQACLIPLLIVIAFVVFLSLIGNPDSGNKDQSASTEQKDTNKKNNVIPFEYKNVKHKRNIKTTAHVVVNLQDGELPTEKQLKATGKQIANQYQSTNNFVNFYIPGAYDQHGPFAVYSHREDDDAPNLLINKYNLPENYKETTEPIQIDKNQKAPASYDDRKKEIEAQFSTWDGSHKNLTRLIKASMNDPDSYEHMETQYVDRKDHLIVITSFRGTNAYGAKVKNTIKAKVGLDGEVLEVMD